MTKSYFYNPNILKEEETRKLWLNSCFLLCLQSLKNGKYFFSLKAMGVSVENIIFTGNTLLASNRNEYIIIGS